MNRPGIPVGKALELRLTPRVFGPGSPGVELRLWSTAAGHPADTRSFVVVPAQLAETLARSLQEVAHESMLPLLFAPAGSTTQEPG